MRRKSAKGGKDGDAVSSPPNKQKGMKNKMDWCNSSVTSHTTNPRASKTSMLIVNFEDFNIPP
jgi:hypothetical protein